MANYSFEHKYNIEDLVIVEHHTSTIRIMSGTILEFKCTVSKTNSGEVKNVIYYHVELEPGRSGWYDEDIIKKMPYTNTYHVIQELYGHIPLHFSKYNQNVFTFEGYENSGHIKIIAHVAIHEIHRHCFVINMTEKRPLYLASDYNWTHLSITSNGRCMYNGCAMSI